MSMTRESRARIALRFLAIKGQGETLERLHRAIEFEIAAASKRIRKVSKSVDSDFIESVTEEETLAIEEFLGLGFVAAQSFMNSIRTELVTVAKVYSHEFGEPMSFAPDPKAGALKYAPVLPATNCSTIQAINAVANYWKHSEEWPLTETQTGGRIREAWDLSTRRRNEKSTIEIVTALGLTPNSPGNMRKAAKALGVIEYHDLSPLRQVLTDWAAELLKQARAEFGGKP
jgi:hypothetical protein